MDGCDGVNVCICVEVYVYMCICVHVYVYMCICVYVYMCICVYVYVCVYTMPSLQNIFVTLPSLNFFYSFGFVVCECVCPG